MCVRARVNHITCAISRGRFWSISLAPSTNVTLLLIVKHKHQGKSTYLTWIRQIPINHRAVRGVHRALQLPAVNFGLFLVRTTAAEFGCNRRGWIRLEHGSHRWKLIYYDFSLLRRCEGDDLRGKICARIRHKKYVLSMSQEERLTVF